MLARAILRFMAEASDQATFRYTGSQGVDFTLTSHIKQPAIEASVNALVAFLSTILKLKI